MKTFLKEDLTSLQRVLRSISTDLVTSFGRALETTCKSLARGGKIIAFGNGGSAADAEHLVGEMLGKFLYDRRPLPAIALTQASPAMTAIGNDYGYEFVFERQLRGLGKKGDIAVGISTSGNSKNVINALKTAHEIGMYTIALTGAADSLASKTADITLKAPSRETPRIQEIHALLIHSFCRGIESELFPKELFPLPSEKLVLPENLSYFCNSLKNFRSVFTNGCFDILHPGHITLLEKAREMGDLLIVGLNTDDSVKALKGPGRPIHSFPDRVKMLSALSYVDFIVGFAEKTPLNLIKRLSPTVLVKGGDYSRDTIVGADWVEKHGGEVRVIPLVKGHSTSRILDRG